MFYLISERPENNTAWRACTPTSPAHLGLQVHGQQVGVHVAVLAAQRVQLVREPVGGNVNAVHGYGVARARIVVLRGWRKREGIS